MISRVVSLVWPYTLCLVKEENPILIFCYVHIRAERYCHISIMIDTKATIHDTYK